jgi:DNA polymerase-2
MVYKGLETVRSDWTPLAQQFQQELYRRIFQRAAYQDYVRDYVARTVRGEFDALLVYRKRLRRPLEDYQRNVPPHVRRAHGRRLQPGAGAAAAIPERRLDQLCDHGGWPGTAGNAALAHRLPALPDAPAAARGGRDIAFLGDDFSRLVSGQQDLF